MSLEGETSMLPQCTTLLVRMRLPAWTRRRKEMAVECCMLLPPGLKMSPPVWSICRYSSVTNSFHVTHYIWENWVKIPQVVERLKRLDRLIRTWISIIHNDVVWLYDSKPQFLVLKKVERVYISCKSWCNKSPRVTVLSSRVDPL